MNLFDNLQVGMVKTVTDVMGYDAHWVVVGGFQQADFDALDFDSQDFLTNTKAGKVLYKGPTEREKLFSAEYDPDKIVMEYQQGVFDGLFEAARKNAPVQQVIIEGIGIFFIKSVKKLWDGKTFEAQLQFV